MLRSTIPAMSAPASPAVTATAASSQATDALKIAIVNTYKKEMTKAFWKTNAKVIAVLAAIVIILGAGGALAFVKSSKALGAVLMGVDALVLAAGSYYLWWVWKPLTESAKAFEAAMLKKSA